MKILRALAKTLVLASLFFFIPDVWAAEVEVSCGDGGCTLSTSAPLFSESGIYPGWSVTKSVKVKNNYSEDLRPAVSVEGATFTDSMPPLAQVLTVTITERESARRLYGPATIEAWKDSGFTPLSTVPAGGERNYDLTLALGDVGNDYQGKQLGFDLNLEFESIPAAGTFLGAALGEISVRWRGVGAALDGVAEGLGGEVAGVEVPSPPVEGTVSGEGAAACRDPFWWPFAILLQGLIAAAIHRLARSAAQGEPRPGRKARLGRQDWERGKRRRWALTAQVATAVAAVLLLQKFFCPWWLPLVGAAVGLAAVYLNLST